MLVLGSSVKGSLIVKSLLDALPFILLVSHILHHFMHTEALLFEVFLPLYF